MKNVIPFAKTERDAVRKKQSRTRAQRIDAYVKVSIQDELEGFTGFLEAARRIWRRYPELVTAAELPANLRRYSKDPNDDNTDGYGVPEVSPAMIQGFKREAEEWLQKEKKSAQ